jgi:hypothetical protein
MDEKIDQIKKILKYADNPDLAYFEKLDQTQETLNEVSILLKSIDINKLESIKGDK